MIYLFAKYVISLWLVETEQPIYTLTCEQAIYLPVYNGLFPSNNPGASGNSEKQQRVDSFFLSSTSNRLLLGSQCAKSLTDAMVEFAVRNMRAN